MFGYSSVSEPMIREGIARLAKALKRTNNRATDALNDGFNQRQCASSADLCAACGLNQNDRLGSARFTSQFE